MTISITSMNSLAKKAELIALFLYISTTSQIIKHLPVSQWVPVYPSAHPQVYELTASVHVAPFIQGVLAHSLTSITKILYYQNMKNNPWMDRWSGFLVININHNYLSRNLKFVLDISTASRSLLQQTEVTDVSHDQCHVTQAGVGLVGAPGRRLTPRNKWEGRRTPPQKPAEDNMP